MKLSPRAFQTFWDVHAWTGVVAALLLHIMFLAGAVTLFHEQIEIWEEPLVQRTAPAGRDGKQRLLDQALAGLKAPPEQFSITLPDGPHGLPTLNYTEPGTETWSSSWIDTETGKLVPLREQLSEFLYRLHFLSHPSVPWLYYVAGVLAIAMLLAIATGVLIHLKDIVRQFHQFRPGKGRRVLWSDMHKVLGVMGLPFQVLYAYSGAMIILGGVLLFPFVGPVFGGDQARAEAVFEGPPEPAAGPLGAPANALSLDLLTERAEAALPGLSLRGYIFSHHGREDGTVEVWGQVHRTAFGQGNVRLRARDGAVLGIESPATESAGQAVKRWLYGLHFAQYGGVFVRAVLALLALGTCAVLLTGNWIWLARREASRDGLGNRLFARLTVGTGAGAFVAVAALFLASRLLPLDWAPRKSAEELTFVAVLAACIAWALAARRGADLWWQQIGLAGLLLFLSPLLAARWSSAGLFGSRATRIPSVLGTDLALLVTGIGLTLVAWALRRLARRDTLVSASARVNPPGPGTVRDALDSAPPLADPEATDA
jgi:uncharacterized iron-regulated membrane protein